MTKPGKVKTTIAKRALCVDEQGLVDRIRHAFSSRRLLLENKAIVQPLSGIDAEGVLSFFRASNHEQKISRREEGSLEFPFYLTAEGSLHFLPIYMVSRIEWDDRVEASIILDWLSPRRKQAEAIKPLLSEEERKAVVDYFAWMLTQPELVGSVPELDEGYAPEIKQALAFWKDKTI